MLRTEITTKPASIYPVLYSFRRCPYAMRARMALLASGQVCEIREVVLRDKPSELLAVSAKATVPVLLTPKGDVLDESLDIMLWALQQHDPECWLSPQYGSLDTMQSLITQCDGDFKFHLDRYKYPERYRSECHQSTDAQFHREACAAFLMQLDAQLGEQQCVRPYLFGVRAALADIAIAPFVRQFAQTDTAWFSMQPWLRLRTWLAAIMDTEMFEQTMHQYPRWQPGAEAMFFPMR